MRKALIKNGIVENIIVVDPNNIPILDGELIDPTGAEIGSLWDGVTFTPPVRKPPPAPTRVSMRQARLALAQAGLLSQINTAVSTLGGTAQIEWEYAIEVERNAPLVTTIASTIGITDTQLDYLFNLAVTFKY